MKMKRNFTFKFGAITLLLCGGVFASAYAQSQVDSLTLSLDQAITIALSDNPTIKVADMEIDRVDYSRKETLCNLFPTIDFSGTYSRTLKKQVMYMSAMKAMPGMEDGIEVGLDNSWSTGFTASLPIIAPALWKSLKLSSNQVEQTLEKARASRIAMVASVKDAFYGVLLAEDSYKVLLQSYENAKTVASDFRNKFDQGVASEYDVLRSEVAVHNYEPTLLQAANALRLAKLNLKVLLGIDGEIKIGLNDRLVNYESAMYENVMKPDTSIVNNTNLKQLDLQTAYLKQALKVQNMQWTPTLALAASYTWNSMSDGGMFKEFRWTPYSYVGLSLSIPIFHGGTRYFKSRQARTAYDEMQYQRVNLERNLRMQVTAAVDNLNKSVKQVASSKESVRQAEKAYKIMQKRFDVGAATIIELNDANLTLVSSNLSYYQSIHDYLAAMTELEEISGNTDFSRYETNTNE